MAKKNPDKIRLEIAKNLRGLGKILIDRHIIIEDGNNPFEEAASECSNNTHNIPIKGIKKSDTWGYSLNKVMIRLDKKKLRGMQPNDAYDVILEYYVDVVGLIQSYGDLCDPLLWLNLNIIISAKSGNNKDVKLKCCWHLDRHLEGGESPEDVHPIYHFHFGGDKMNFSSSSYDYGSTLFLASPRLAHKPLEGVLATDFVLSNFVSHAWKGLIDPVKGNFEYRNIVRTTHDHIWKPYAISTSKRWEPYQLNQVSWNPAIIWPQLIMQKA